MLFLELAAQSVRGFSPSIRVPLKAGYMALQSPGDLPAPLVGLVLALVFPDGRGGEAAFLAPGAKTGRAGLSIQGNDGAMWRIIRDLGGVGGLHKLNTGTNQFEVISQDAQEMGRTLRSTAGFPARSTWEQLFTLTGPQLPTRRPKGPASAGMGRTPSGGLNASSRPEEPSRLEALEAELAVSRRAADIQFRLDGVNAELYALEAKLKGWDGLKGRLAAARSDLESAPDHSTSLPPDIIDRAKRYPEERKRHEEHVAKLQAERQALLDEVPVRPAPLWTDQRFLGSVAGGLALFVAARFLEGGLRYVGLLSMVPLAFAGLLALRHIEQLQAVERGRSRSDLLALREKKLMDEFLLTSSVVQRAFEQVGASTVDEFVAVLGRRAALQAEQSELEAQWAQVESDPEFASVTQKAAELKADQEKCTRELLEMSGGYVRDVRDIERDIARLKEPEAPPRPSPAGEGFAAVSSSPAEIWDDPTPALLIIATDLFGTDIPSLWSVLHDRAVQYLSALTDRRYHELSVDKDGRATLEAPGRSVSARDLPGKDLDLAYLALRLTLIEKLTVQHKLPVVIEDTFNTVLGAAKQPLFARMVKHLGSLTQVLHVSGAGQNASLADPPSAL